MNFFKRLKEPKFNKGDKICYKEHSELEFTEPSSLNKIIEVGKKTYLIENLSKYRREVDFYTIHCLYVKYNQ